MAEVIHHRHTARDALHFHAALDAAEGAEGVLNLLVLESAVLGRANNGERIAHIQFTDEIDLKFETRNLERARRGTEADVERVNRIVFAQTEAFHGTESDVRNQRRDVRVVAVREQQTV